MSDDESKSLDIFGVRPIADAISKVTTATVDGSAAFLSRICLPAAEEFGLLLRDRVRGWRVANITAITKKAEETLAATNALEGAHAHPRIVANILEEGSWIEDPVVQDLWAGLLSSSCTESGDDDSNLIFIDLLANLTKLQARLLNYLCENGKKFALPNGLIQVDETSTTTDELVKITSETDIQRLDRELDHLRQLGLVYGGLDPEGNDLMSIGPTSLALHLFVRGQGSRDAPIDYFQISISNE